MLNKKMFKGKKGVTAAFLVGMMITLIAFILISGTLLRFMSESEDLAAEKLCKASIDLRAMSAIRLEAVDQEFDVSVAPPIMCKTIDKKVSGEKEKVMKEFADNIAKCWEMFGEGRYDEILDTTSVNLVFNTANLENECFNCYVLLVEELEGETIENFEMMNYLMNTEYRANMSYLDYVQSHGGPGRVFFTAPTITENYAYTISMMPKNKELESGIWQDLFEIGAGSGITAAGVMTGIGIVAVGGVAAACVVGTGGICAGGLAVVLGGSTTAAEAIAGGVILHSVYLGGTVSAAGAVTGSYVSGVGFWDLMAKLYETERDVSSIYIGHLKTGEEMCGSGDIAGQ